MRRVVVKAEPSVPDWPGRAWAGGWRAGGLNHAWYVLDSREGDGTIDAFGKIAMRLLLLSSDLVSSLLYGCGSRVVVTVDAVLVVRATWRRLSGESEVCLANSLKRLACLNRVVLSSRYKGDV